MVTNSYNIIWNVCIFGVLHKLLTHYSIRLSSNLNLIMIFHSKWKAKKNVHSIRHNSYNQKWEEWKCWYSSLNSTEKKTKCDSNLDMIYTRRQYIFMVLYWIRDRMVGAREWVRVWDIETCDEKRDVWLSEHIFHISSQKIIIYSEHCL